MKILFNSIKFNELFKGMEKTYKSVSPNPLTKNINFEFKMEQSRMITTNDDAWQFCEINSAIESVNDIDLNGISFALELKKVEKIIKIAKKHDSFLIEKANKGISLSIPETNKKWTIKTDKITKYPKYKASENAKYIEDNDDFLKRLKAVTWVADRSGKDEETFKRMIYFGNNSIQAINGSQAVKADYDGIIFNVSVDRTMIEAVLAVSKNNPINFIDTNDDILIIGNTNRKFMFRNKQDKFPIEWNNVLENNFNIFNINTKSLINELEGSIVIAEDIDDNKVLLSASDNQLKILCQNNENSFSSEIEISTELTNQNAVLNVDVLKLIDGLKRTFVDEDIIMKIKNNFPILFEYDNILYLQTPIN